MRYRKPEDDGWRKRFAILPINLREEIIWLEWYWAREMGLYTEVYPGRDRPAPLARPAGEIIGNT